MLPNQTCRSGKAWSCLSMDCYDLPNAPSPWRLPVTFPVCATDGQTPMAAHTCSRVIPTITKQRCLNHLETAKNVITSAKQCVASAAQGPTRAAHAA